MFSGERVFPSPGFIKSCNYDQNKNETKNRFTQEMIFFVAIIRPLRMQIHAHMRTHAQAHTRAALVSKKASTSPAERRLVFQI